MPFTTLDLSKQSGTLGVANGGTGLSSGTSGQFLKFTGSTTVGSAAVSSDLVLIQSQSSTSASSLSFTTGFDGTYDTHMFIVNDLDVSDDGCDFYARIFHTDASTEGTGGYVYANHGFSADGSARTQESTSTSKIMLFGGVDNYATYKSGLTLWLGKPDATGLKRIWWNGAFERNSSGSNTSYFGGACYTDSSNAIKGMKFYPSAGTFATVTINHYGLKGS